MVILKAVLTHVFLIHMKEWNFSKESVLALITS